MKSHEFDLEKNLRQKLPYFIPTQAYKDEERALLTHRFLQMRGRKKMLIFNWNLRLATGLMMIILVVTMGFFWLNTHLQSRNTTPSAVSSKASDLTDLSTTKSQGQTALISNSNLATASDFRNEFFKTQGAGDPYLEIGTIPSIYQLVSDTNNNSLLKIENQSNLNLQEFLNHKVQIEGTLEKDADGQMFLQIENIKSLK
ncbi:hypothetical protein COS81_04035 [candidate division WWE3 bacterium CG06_land_8_20_14_3_00_42_16]|uniref:Uncharacterized protein n=4 Tax=Katanobacteria TaxID=422282 RepID=A0A2M7AM09_UNCKA|nr:MAG: hypothetical protein AUJ38_00750 [bacterium CG1_02_42_9]PIU68405.1 MAG: hypothetical protein COS81_04035 [candidate division WWE3 bacterium CG06_land_8_20_14_3_00_42_16]PIZ43154.1 MAG: hypothetical protein COY34_01470 [candidate division WWE3 bacterium CG_4_10_14_0_2_um_filter_42_8]PJA37690.1 MAG: hypothetical protein CO181_02480 [candidate division WWE3 bacterium CG_4_9_14_3_um_filter_43_9]PJC68400.1 MAG: hypothetical protein CO015_04145 [candidate division WWE3 bacterium CG_4_8_14_3_u